MSGLNAFLLEKTIKRPKKQKQPITNVTRHGQTLKGVKDLKYAQFVPLYELWKGYFASCYGSPEALKADERLLKADLHGCLLMVTVADNACMIGISGIVVRESRNTFQLITADDRLLTIPKRGSTFQFVLDGHVFTLFGDAFRNTAAGRSQRKFKNVAAVPHLLDRGSTK